MDRDTPGSCPHAAAIGTPGPVGPLPGSVAKMNAPD